jgi:cytidylate kinase
MSPYPYHIIAVDGPAASGKSSVSRRLANQLGLAFVSSGLMYRAFTWLVCESPIDIDDADAIIALMKETTFQAARRGNELYITVNGQDPGDALTSDRVNSNVSKIATIPEVREVLVAEQRACGNTTDIVMEGRDIGSVVFPDTSFKFYLDASEEVRAQRRADQGLQDEIAERDRVDSTRKASPLKVADGAIVVDTSTMDLNQVVAALANHLKTLGFP